MTTLAYMGPAAQAPAKLTFQQVLVSGYGSDALGKPAPQPDPGGGGGGGGEGGEEELRSHWEKVPS
eukprot:SAG25_NODE_9157_length_385_cov_0.709790_1_plen_66_part_00